MGHRRKGVDRRKKDQQGAHPRRLRRLRLQLALGSRFGAGQFWRILCSSHNSRNLLPPRKTERGDLIADAGPNAKLLAHLLDLAFDKIPVDPGNPVFRHGGTLGKDRRNWFRAKIGNGRYRLFYRFQSSAQIIVSAWVNDVNSLRTYGSRRDAYAMFANMLDAGNPPDSWDALVAAASARAPLRRLGALTKRHARRKK